MDDAEAQDQWEFCYKHAWNLAFLIHEILKRYGYVAVYYTAMSQITS